MLTINRLSIDVDDKSIVRGSTFSIPKGKITAMIGESGSGKSMTVAALLGMLPIGARVTGQANFKGKNILEFNQKDVADLRKKHVFTIFQDASNSFNPSIKMGRQIYEFSGRRRGDTVDQFKKKIMLYLDDLNLSKEIMEQYPFELSGGMLQRCMIACALYVKPDLLIADEPTSALDKALQEEFIEQLKRLNQVQETTILLITHDLDVVEKAAHEMVVMKHGEVVETGAVKAVFEQPRHSYTERLLASRL